MLAAPILLHAFGARYDLPISLSLYLYAAAGVVVLSFVMVVVLAGDRLGAGAAIYPRWSSPSLTAAARSPLPRIIGGGIGVLALVTIIATGLFGSPSALLSPAELLTWIYFWGGLLIASCLVGNLWAPLNPWAAIFDLMNRVQPLAPMRSLPERLGIWPAAFLLLAFACLELTSGVANVPAVIGVLAVLYTMFTLAGMVIFGRDGWLGQVEFFSVLFGIVGRFGPVETERDDRGGVARVWLRPWGAGLLRPQRGGWDWVVFIVLMLSTLAFDGIKVTPNWIRSLGALEVQWPALQGGPGPVLLQTGGLILVSLTFLLVFVAFMRMVIVCGGGAENHLEAVTAFALTLVPIALVYNAAHNYSYLVVQSQLMFPLFLNPLAVGIERPPVPSFVLASAALVWYLQVILIVLGHVIAVFLAHLRAGERFKTGQRALLSQYPMLLLMVLYTMTSLWILAQPITSERGG